MLALTHIMVPESLQKLRHVNSFEIDDTLLSLRCEKLKDCAFSDVMDVICARSVSESNFRQDMRKCY